MRTFRNQLPRRILAEDFLDDVTFVESVFYLLEGKHPQAWDVVLGGYLGFKLNFRGSVATILPSLQADRQISVMAGALGVIPCQFPNLLVI